MPLMAFWKFSKTVLRRRVHGNEENNANATLSERRIAIAALQQIDSLAAQNLWLDLIAALNPRAIREVAEIIDPVRW